MSASDLSLRASQLGRATALSGIAPKDALVCDILGRRAFVVVRLCAGADDRLDEVMMMAKIVIKSMRTFCMLSNRECVSLH